MRDAPSPRGAQWSWTWICVAWLGVSLAWTPAALLVEGDADWRATHLASVFAQMLIHFAPWALSVPFFLKLSRLWPIGLGRGGRHIVHFGLLGLVIVPVFTAAGVAVSRVVLGALRGVSPDVALEGLGQATLITGLFALPTFIAVVAVAQMVAYLERYRGRERLLSQARAAALRAQVAPHFLFNAMNAIAELVHADAPRAERALVALADLLRETLDRPGWTSLREEVAFVAEYVELHRLLLGDRLRFELDVADEAWDAIMPALLLQPLVENALIHGISRLPCQGTLSLRAGRAEGGLEIVITNDVPASTGRSGSGTATGLGLANVRQRIGVLYGGRGSLGFIRGKEEARASVWLPLEPVQP